MVSDEQAMKYIQHLKKNRRPKPAKENELHYLQTFDASTDAFINTGTTQP